MSLATAVSVTLLEESACAVFVDVTATAKPVETLTSRPTIMPVALALRISEFLR
ncbi:MAG: hypothetical protein ACJAS7_000936 [Alpinimonas sp.]|jgi:hypothetical protein